MKICRKCKQEKSLECFNKKPKNKSGLEAVCKMCTRIRVNIWKAKNKDKVKRHNYYYGRWWKYGLTEEQYIDMLNARENKCAICGQEETSKNKNGAIKRLSIDHDHRTDEIRGLLCSRCNLILGHAKDDVQILQSAIDYLLRHALEHR